MKRKLKQQKQFLSKFWNACNFDQLRPAMNCVYFKDGFLYATNAMIAVRQKISIHPAFKDCEKILDGKMIHARYFDKLKNAFSVEFTDECINANIIEEKQGHIIRYSISFSYEKDLVFPDAETIFKDSFKKLNETKIDSIGLNPDLLASFTNCFYTNGHPFLSLYFTEKNKSIIVIPFGNESKRLSGIEQIGLCMPTMMFGVEKFEK